MAPTPSPLHPLLSDAKDTWTRASTVMSWFTKLVTTLYGWSDGLIKHRQNRANKIYKIEKAEKEALRIMNAQQKRRNALNGTVNGVARGSAKVRRGLVDELDESLDIMELLTLLEQIE